MTSATGTDIQIPASLNIRGNNINDKDKNKNVLEKEIIPEMIPLPRAVKKLEANTDIPKINNDGA